MVLRTRVTMSESIVLPTPWDGVASKRWSALRRLVAFDAAALLLVDPSRPNASGVLGMRSLSLKQVGDWLGRCAKGDTLLRRAAKSGLAETTKPLAQPGAALPKGMRAVVAAEPCAPGSGFVWALALGRRKGGFTAEEGALARLALMTIRSRFDTIAGPERGMHRVLADGDGQVMHVDTDSRLTLAGDLSRVQTLVDEVLSIATQRWPGQETDSTAHDVFPPTDLGEARWVRFQRLPGAGRGLPGAFALWVRPIHGAAPPAVGRIEDDRVAQAIGVVTDQYAHAPKLDGLAKQFDVSPFHFHRLFSERAQISPKQLVLRVQLLHARLALRTTRTPVAQIAADCGFASHGHFTSTFHRIVGLTPLEYRLGEEPTG